jgi:GNAT superfamily N-acetyltransferase
VDGENEMTILETEDQRFPKFDVEFEGKVVGRAIVFIRPHPYQTKPVLELLELFVDPEHRRKGIARSLVKRVIEHAAKENCLAVHLVSSNPILEIYLYEPEGFEMNIKARNYICLLDKKISKE